MLEIERMESKKLKKKKQKKQSIRVGESESSVQSEQPLPQQCTQSKFIYPEAVQES